MINRLFALLILMAFLLAPSFAAAVEIEFLPGPHVLQGDPVRVRVSGVDPGALVTIQASSVMLGSTWRSQATFRADEAGLVDLAVSAPIDGSYSGVDPTGLFWSMMKEGPAVNDGVPEEARKVMFRATSDGNVSSSTLTMFATAPGVTSEEVTEPVVGRLYLPKARPAPGIVLLGGSDGGLSDTSRAMGSLLASKGYVTLAVAYFDAPGTASQLEEIPLEYFDDAVGFLRDHIAIGNRRIAVIGRSKGAEAALLVAANNAAISAVIAMVPSSIAWQGINRTGGFQSGKSSWSRAGRPVAFLPYDPRDFWRTRKFVDLYALSLKANAEAIEKAAIPVHQIAGKVLLLSGGKDAVWPSSKMSENIVARMNAAGRGEDVRHIAYAEAGHFFNPPGFYATTGLEALGGSAKANAHAAVDSWNRVLSFLEETVDN